MNVRTAMIINEKLPIYNNFVMGFDVKTWIGWPIAAPLAEPGRAIELKLKRKARSREESTAFRDSPVCRVTAQCWRAEQAESEMSRKAILDL
jgi:hypothetical protein